MQDAVKALWGYRGFISGSVKREFQSKYRNSLLGVAWTVLQPLAMIIVYTVIFSQVMRAKLPGAESLFGYSIYLCAGILTWGFFSEIVGRAQNIFIENANLLKKLSFPRLCLPVILVLSACLNFTIIFTLFTAFLLISGQFPGWVFVALFPVFLIQILFSVGLGITLGVLNVFFRDVGQLFGVVLQFWFWLTPIVYPASILPAAVKSLMEFNPMASFIGAYQKILVYGQWPVWGTLWFPALLSICLCAWALRLFRKHSGELVDEL
ncbi:lipopolysaccharide transport system permease protein [Pseudomonas protegens]|uniref:ABC transporter permease n=1 Tax=Pseudomonas TaxID=286 RepID=UPI0009084742|nr:MULTISPECIES: ABC transporter permease [Pseudomonas]APC20321.1 ABC transporter [Pseudomonas protegens]MBF0642464.1 ABC transporter permease [Pseudomonas protegens]MCU1766933.1 ABC transporter permease [Pseudomonas protegens]MDS9876715.1 ABC transporter permease [Pseudomonas protegens]MDT9642439.1 ABC transporter permease [Pseudomonas sp. JV245A]